MGSVHRQQALLLTHICPPVAPAVGGHPHQGHHGCSAVLARSQVSVNTFMRGFGMLCAACSCCEEHVAKMVLARACMLTCGLYVLQTSQPRRSLSVRGTLPKVEAGALYHAPCRRDSNCGPLPPVLCGCLASLQAERARPRCLQGDLTFLCLRSAPHVHSSGLLER